MQLFYDNTNFLPVGGQTKNVPFWLYAIVRKTNNKSSIHRFEYQKYFHKKNRLKYFYISQL